MKISVIPYAYNEPFTKDQVPNNIGRYGPFFQEVEMQPGDLKSYMKNNIVWSPFLFEGGARKGEFNKMQMDCLVFDYDEGSLDRDEILKRMRKLEYFNLCYTKQVIFAGSPRNNNDGLHKYRIIIPFGETLKIDDMYPQVYQRICDDMASVGVPLDATKDLARMFYSTDFADIYSASDDIQGDFGLMYRFIRSKIKNEKKAAQKQKILNIYGSKSRAKKFSGDLPSMEVAYQRWPRFKGYTDDMSVGQRGKIQYSLMCYLQKAGYSRQDFEEFVLNHQEIPWEDDDMERTFKNNMKSW